jgi:hypothetical protein
VISEDRKALRLHEVPAEQEAGEPILLNWPDCIARRGGEVRFTPKLSVEAKVEAEVIGTLTPTTVQVNGNEIAFKLSASEPGQHFVLNLKCTPKSGAVTSYRIPIHSIESPLPTAVDLATTDNAAPRQPSILAEYMARSPSAGAFVPSSMCLRKRSSMCMGRSRVPWQFGRKRRASISSPCRHFARPDRSPRHAEPATMPVGSAL